ncbi:MAG: ATP-binding protein [Patescibacteria group bacterium]|jgi:hypothetical protein
MYFPRKIEKELKKELDSKKIIVLTGMRRTGKTSLMKHIFDSVKSSNKVYLDLENPLNQKIFEEENYDNILKNLSPLGIVQNQKSYIFLDEVQNMKNIPSAVKYLSDHYDAKFFLTGSSSYYLKNLFSESMSGRKFIFEIFPLDFEEYLSFRGKNKEFPADFFAKEKAKNKIYHELYKKDYDEYLEFGGFPSVVLEENRERKRMELNEIFTSYFELDVKTLADFRNIGKFRDLIILLSARCGSKLDISKLSRELQSARETVYNYLAFLEHTYFITLIGPFSKNSDREISGAKKIYFCDTGMANLLGGADSGAIFENSAFNNLKKTGAIRYYQKRTGAEIDFIVNKTTAIEIKNRASRFDFEKTKKLADRIGIREVYVASKEYSEDKGIILAMDL